MEVKPLQFVPRCGPDGKNHPGCICFTQDELGKTGLLGKEKQGQCHRFPPQIVSVTATTLRGVGLVPGAMFPQVAENFWCAEFRPRPTDKAIKPS